jgi:putative hydrolase of the HAD superfamily
VPEAILIDLFNTLIDDGGGAARDDVTGQMGRVLGVDEAAFTALFHRHWRERLIGALGPLDVMLADFARQLGGAPSAAEITAAVALRTELTTSLLATARPGTLRTLDTLRANGFRLALVSNCTTEVATIWKSSPFGDRFDAVALSCELGLGKPDPAIYRWATDALGVTPQQCLYVGDGADGELAGAAALGMTVLRTTEFADTDPTWPGPTISALTELTTRTHPS